MAVPLHKLPELLRTPVHLSKISRITVLTPPRIWYNNQPRYFYKNKAPLVKYYNPNLKIELKYAPGIEPKVEVFDLEGKLALEIDNRTQADMILPLLQDFDSKYNSNI
jgi:hypothetical protein